MLHLVVFALMLHGGRALGMADAMVLKAIEARPAVSLPPMGDDASLQAPDLPVPEPPSVFPVPTTSRCIVIIVCQYMIVYTALAACRTYHELTGTGKGKAEEALKSAAQTLTYGPMLCVLFIACRMRVDFLSNGKDEPQTWVQNCMYSLTFAVLTSTVLVLLIPLVVGRPLPVKEGTCDLEAPTEFEADSKLVFQALTALRYMIFFGLYIGLAGVILGMLTYMPPGATTWSDVPAPAPAVTCTMILSVVFFAMQLVIAMCRSYTEFTGVEFPKIVGIVNAATTTVEFAPMLAVLFLAARMRALQHHSEPQPWAQNCMYLSTGAVCFSTALSVAVPLAMGGSTVCNPITKAYSFEVPDATIGYILQAMRYVAILSFFAGTVGVAYSIFAFQAQAPEETLPVSATVRCVVNLTCQYFFVNLMMILMLTFSEITGGIIPVENWTVYSAIEAAKSTIAFAPMLSILFVTTRMYALLITDNRGAPPAWVQHGMYMSTWSLLISFMMCLIAGLVMDKVETDADGNVVNKFSNRYIGYVVTAVRYFCMILLYGGILMVVVGLFTMTPENANGAGSIPVVTQGVDATPVGHPPPGLDEVGKVVVKPMPK